ncbi:MAG TPA: flagellar FliJ family protein [Stellaceae bacterium]|nr:flagellar FliJ family protein [Stellaceae bacterium]
MSTFDTLIRIHRWQVDERRRQLVELEVLAERVRQDLQRLAEERELEAAVADASPEAHYGYAGYIRGALDRRATLERSLAEAEEQIVQAREAVAAAFQEMKRYEIAAANRERHRRQLADRRERLELDGIALDNYRRRSGAA